MPPRRSICLAVLAAMVAGCGSSGPSQRERDRAIEAARHAFAEAKGSGRDLSAGPCIAERLPRLSDWVVDVAHDPRRPVDDLPRNQCARFRAGQAHHFVELSPQGRVIRAE